MRILGVSGSLGRGSANTAILREAVHHVVPPDELVLHDENVDALPHFSPDHDPDACPPSVDRWRRAVAAADALLIATPEYAGGMPGSLKNALDWLVGSGELYGKPVVIVNATPSAERGRRARESVALTLTMQGGEVRDSFAVAVRRDAPAEELAARASEVATRATRALAS